MSREQDLLDLAKEIAAVEGISLAVALQVARRELQAVTDYAQEWDYMVARQSPAQPYRVNTA
jgi:hypothetical protein